MRKVLWLIPLLLVGCRSWRQTVEVPVYLHDTVHTVQVQHDSTYVDRWHTVEVKGDTVRWRDSVVVYRWRTTTDTALKVVERPVEVVRTEVQQVAKPLTWLQRTLIYIGIGAVVLLVLWVLWKVVARRKLPS